MNDAQLLQLLRYALAKEFSSADMAVAEQQVDQIARGRRLSAEAMKRLLRIAATDAEFESRLLSALYKRRRRVFAFQLAPLAVAAAAVVVLIFSDSHFFSTESATRTLLARSGWAFTEFHDVQGKAVGGMLNSQDYQREFGRYSKQIARSKDCQLLEFAAKAAIAAGDDADAQQFVEQWRRLDPSNPAVHNALGLVLLLRDRPADASAMFDAARRLDASNADYVVNQVVAGAHLDALAQLKPDHPALPRLRGWLSKYRD
jgi:predicted Zn-dependent protease